MLENHLDWTGGVPSVLNPPHAAILDNGECRFGNLAAGMFWIIQAEMGEPTAFDNALAERLRHDKKDDCP
ncbi:MAG: hypothetical protein JW932_10055 [Deltaproteobacteria bacterium]|nr:hypothetical protein [Deltaproteobacteria bacterium]